MYSMVLMAALTTGTDLPDWGRRGGCCGCYGGWGGCYGGWGGCYGGWGGCYGGWGGCYGGWGGGYGGWGGYARWGYGYGGYGAYGGWGAYGGLGYAYAPTFIGAYNTPTLTSNTAPANNLNNRSMYYNPDTAADNSRATITIHVPENATLTVNGKQMSSTSGTRRFLSSPLDPGQSYHYNFEVRMDRDGKVVKVDRRVDVRAGDRLEFTISPTDAAPVDNPRTADDKVTR